MKFTDKSIKALKPKSERYEIWDESKGGFGIRVTPRGVKTFVWMYRYDGKAKRLSLGNYPQMSLYEAGRALAEAKVKLHEGVDPGNEIVQSRKDHRNAVLIEELVREYLTRHAQPNKRSAFEDERILYKDFVPQWSRRKAKDITKKDVLSILDTILERGAPIAANRSLACIRKVFNWALSRDILEANPCTSIKLPSRENRRERVLTQEEIVLFWHNLKHASMTPLIKLALKLQLVVAQRKAEILSAMWIDINLNTKIWTIPAERAKNGLAHRVPLSDIAWDILMEIKEISGSSPYLFPSHLSGKIIQGSSVDHALRKNRKILGLEDVTPHDLRRTGASHMASLGINRLVISKILNHVDQSVTAIYDRYSYDAEKKQALDIWGQHLTQLIESEPNGQKNI